MTGSITPRVKKSALSISPINGLGSFGGPIRKDKLFFFFDTEGTFGFTLSSKFLQVNIPSPQFEAATIAPIDLSVWSGFRVGRLL